MLPVTACFRYKVDELWYFFARFFFFIYLSKTTWPVDRGHYVKEFIPVSLYNFFFFLGGGKESREKMYMTGSIIYMAEYMPGQMLNRYFQYKVISLMLTKA